MSEGTPIAKIKVNIVWGAFGNGENCTGIVEKIDMPETGGIFTKYLGCNYLFKGYPDEKVIATIAVPKKIIAGGISFLSQKVSQFVLASSIFIFLILPKPLKRKFIFLILDYFLIISHLAVRRFILLPEKYCISVKEIEIVLTKMISEVKDSAEVQTFEIGRDVLCMLLEYDYAYRARFQDVLPYLDKEWLKENPKKEICRIFDILIERESSCLVKFKKLKKILMFILKFKEIRDFLVDFLLKIDLEKIRLDEADWYYVLDRSDYSYGGLTHEERMKQKLILDQKVGNHLPKIIFKAESEKI